MLLAVETVASEEVEVSMSEVVEEDVVEEAEGAEEDTSKKVVEGAAVHMKMDLIHHISPVTLRIQSGPQSQTIQGKG